MPQKLTAKQRKWLKIYMETHNATEAAMQVYNVKTRESAGVIGHENLKKLNFEELMDAVGLTEENLLESIVEGRKATRVIVIDNKVQGVPDYATRHKYIETALKLRGNLSNKLELTGKDGEPLKIQLLAGISYHYDTGPETVDASSDRGTPKRPTPVPSIDMAPEGPKNNNSDQ
jgi:hypothetical protein